MPFGIELVLRGSRERFGPTVLTAVATGAAFVPVLVIGDVAGQEVIYPMAAVVLGGLLTLLPVSLLVVPALYLAFGGRVTEIELDILQFEEELSVAAPPSYTQSPDASPGRCAR